MKLKILLVFSLIFVILTLSAVSAEDNLTQGENTGVLEKTVQGNTFNDIQTAVSESSDGDTLELNGTYTGSASAISISKSITIEGNGATLDAGKKSSILKVKSKSLTVKNVKFTNSIGEAIGAEDSEILIINCTFIKNGGKLTLDSFEKLYVADADFAGVSAKNSKVTIIDSKFSDNSIANVGYSIWVDNGELTCINTTFSNHSLDYDRMIFQGFIVYLEGTKSSFDRCTFKDNTVPAIYTDTYAVISNSNFENNYRILKYFGSSKGGITPDSHVNVINSTFAKTKNNAFTMVWNVALNITGSNFTQNTESIIDSMSEVSVSDCEFTKNSAKNGAVFTGFSKLTVENSKFVSNTADKGSVIYSYDYPDAGEKISKYINIINSTIEDSYAGVEGGAIYATYCNVRLADTNISTRSSSKGSQIYLIASTVDSINSTHQTVKVGKFNFVVVDAYPSVATFDSGKKFSVNVCEKINGEYQVVSYVKTKFKVFTGKKYKTYYYDASKISQRDPFFRITSDLSVGKHKIEVSSNSKYITFPKKTFTLTVKKATATVKAKKITAKYKKSKYFKITVKNKASGKVVGKIKVKLKVCTGKKYKSYVLKTDKKGEVKLNTKKLSRGTHKVEITSKNKNYEFYKKSSIKIK